MAIFRNVNMSFWTDTKVTDEYTPEDRYFMLYALTNQYTNIIGCYEISIKQMSNDLGYTKDVITNLLDRFSNIHKTIKYDDITKELLVLNWSKYNWNASPKLNVPLYSAIIKVKSDKFFNYLAEMYNARDTVEEEIPLRVIENVEDKEIVEVVKYYEEVPAIKKVVDKTDYEKEFAEVWKEYPRKQGKANAYKAYLKARKKGISEQTILDGIYAYVDYIEAEKVDAKYIKQGSTWFNQECWNDDYTIKRSATTKNISIDISDF